MVIWRRAPAAYGRSTGGWEAQQPRWPAILAFVVAFAAVPFMDTTWYVGSVAAELHGGD
ncbi:MULTISPECIES: hypothetical protein [unclassified Streptomyces]|uniref:hypothetical protein n=1 Tax=unclassified Streptomyces TaxID=2593676 RepID=UPI003D89D83F